MLGRSVLINKYSSQNHLQVWQKASTIHSTINTKQHSNAVSALKLQAQLTRLLGSNLWKACVPVKQAVARVCKWGPWGPRNANNSANSAGTMTYSNLAFSAICLLSSRSMVRIHQGALITARGFSESWTSFHLSIALYDPKCGPKIFGFF